MKAYSLDLRKKIVESVTKGISKSQTAQRFGVDRATVKRYCKRLDECSTLAPSKRSGRRPKLDQRAMKLLEIRPQGEALGDKLSEEGVPVCHLRGERDDGLPSTQAPLSQPKKDPEQPQKETS